MINDETVEKVWQKIKVHVDYEHFFESINSPDWIKPLQKKGCFKRPPLPQPSGDGYILPSWVESRYLARVASKAPNEVLAVIKSIPDTENPRVHSDYIDAALAMPPSIALKLVNHAKKWVDSDYAFSFPRKYGALIEHLSKSGNWKATFSIGESLMALNEKPLYSKPMAEFGDRRRAVPKFSDWEYEQILKKIFPSLVDKFPIETVSFLSKLLKQALTIEGDSTELHGKRDFSYIWRPMIARNEAGYPGDVKDRILDCLRDAIIAVIKNDPEQITKIIKILDSAATPFHQRIALFSLNLIGDEFKTLKVSKLEEKHFIIDHTYWKEFAALLKRNFHFLTTAQQESLFSTIDNGPEKTIPEEADERKKKQLEKYARHWQFERYSVIKDVLTGEREAYLDSLIEEFGETEDPEQLKSRFGSWVGPTSPINDEELKKLNTDQIIQYLRTWVPKKDHFSPSPNGLGRTLSGIVKARPLEFVDRLQEFQTLNKTYARSVLEGISGSLEKTIVDWDKILPFLEWIVNQQSILDPSVELASHDEDPHWGWTKQTIARLIHSQLEVDGEFEIPFKKRDAIWRVIEKLTWEDNPNEKDDAKYEETGQDAYQHSINTVRGEALHTVVAYALWVGRRIENQGTHDSFGAMPEVKKNLDAHLNPEKEQSATIHSVYGRWLPWLQYLDRKWTVDNLNKIFPENDKRLLNVAWDTFVMWTSPYDEVFDLIKDQYAKAVQRLEHLGDRSKSSHSPEKRLAEHLMAFYWRDNDGLTIESEIITNFFKFADPKLRRHAVSWIGRSLAGVKEPISETTLAKLKKLFEWRLKINQIDNGSDHSEVEDFGWWLASKKLPIEWTLPLAEEVLDLCKSIDPLFMVFEAAKDAHNTNPELVLSFIAKLVDSIPLNGSFYGWPNEMEAILRTAITDEATRTVAQDIAQKLIGMGFKNFKEVLK